ncbi:hypothetical protein M422DRAFT_27863 [Sphaerobolus stellatus SS14]|nr:hypothetical protein M422DRAFT_27863 [Sphaerobolus stellatus SS14]
MSSFSSADTPSFAGSSILRESPPFSSAAYTGPGGADLSLSELYISEREEDNPRSRPFSLLPLQHAQHDATEEERGDHSVFSDSGGLVEEEGDVTIVGERKSSFNEARQREERLQRDLFVLKKLNASFALYNGALKDVRSTTENVALQLDRTDRLLDQYVSLLQHTEKNTKLIFDETWQGGEADLETLERLRIEKEEKDRREREERERRARLEEERRAKEEEERKAKEEREARERLKSATLIRGLRGVRPTRVSERGSSIPSRGRIPSSATARRGASEIPVRGSGVTRGTRRT